MSIKKTKNRPFSESPSMICFILSAVLTGHLTTVSATAGLLSYQTAPPSSSNSAAKLLLQLQLAAAAAQRPPNRFHLGQTVWICYTGTTRMYRCTVCSPALLHLQFIEKIIMYRRQRASRLYTAVPLFTYKPIQNFTVGMFRHSAEWVESHEAGTSHVCLFVRK